MTKTLVNDNDFVKVRPTMADHIIDEVLAMNAYMPRLIKLLHKDGMTLRTKALSANCLYFDGDAGDAIDHEWSPRNIATLKSHHSKYVRFLESVTLNQALDFKSQAKRMNFSVPNFVTKYRAESKALVNVTKKYRQAMKTTQYQLTQQMIDLLKTNKITPLNAVKKLKSVNLLKWSYYPTLTTVRNNINEEVKTLASDFGKKTSFQDAIGDFHKCFDLDKKKVKAEYQNPKLLIEVSPNRVVSSKLLVKIIENELKNYFK